MENIFTDTTSIYWLNEFVWSLIIGAGLFFIFRILRYFLIPQIKKVKIRERIIYYSPAIEAIIWLIYVTVVLIHVFFPSPFIGLAIFLLLIIAGWRFLKDFVAGIIFKLEAKINVGQKIKFNDHVGIISTMDYLSTKIEVENGESIIVRYSDLSNFIITQANASESLKSHLLKLKIKSDKDIGIIKEDIKSIIYNLPWSLGEKAPVIEYETSDEVGHQFKVILYALENAHFRLMENSLRKSLETNP